MFEKELTPEESQLVNKMEQLGADFSDFFIVIKENLNAFIAANQAQYNEASKTVRPTAKQIDMIEKIIDKGVSYDSDVFKYMSDAYSFIGQHYYLLRKPHTQTSAADWGGIPNH